MGVAGGRRASGPWRRPGDARDASGGPEAAPGPRQRRRLHPRRPRPLLRHLRPRPPIRRAPRRPDRSYPSPLRFLLAPCAWNVARGRTARGCMAQASRGGSSLLSCPRWRAVAAQESGVCPTNRISDLAGRPGIVGTRVGAGACAARDGTFLRPGSSPSSQPGRRADSAWDWSGGVAAKLIL